MRVLVTGGAGYIGSHTCKQLSRAGIEPVVYDNLSRGQRHNVKWGPLVEGDIRDGDALDRAFAQYRPEACIHFAAFAYVGESIEQPTLYYENNVVGTLSLLKAMRRAEIEKLVFSSSCATYGIPQVLPITENTEQKPINPYGASKLMGERIIEDFGAAYGLRFACLRYFNACGADLDGELHEEHDPETHLIPRCLMAAAGSISQIDVFGDDYDTEDGTCVRDYIHVADLAEGHVLALQSLMRDGRPLKLNLGTGRGHSIKAILDEIESITGRPVPFRICPRRPGDPPALIADCDFASQAIGFKATRSSLSTILRTAARKYGLA